jgi:lactoylglutathione lyase
VLFVDIHFDLMMLPDYGVDKYDIGTGFGHFGIAVEDVSSSS